MSSGKPLILLSNDDGYRAKGLRSLLEMLSDMADLLVCAPDSPRSGFSCAFSASSPLSLTPREKADGLEVWSTNGTPVDCVKLALSELCGCRGLSSSSNNPSEPWLSSLAGGRKPSMVIAGINHGDNASVNSHYSGTMGATMEGCMKFIPSVAFSLCDHDLDADFSLMAPIIRKIVGIVLKEGLPQCVCLNVNFPVVEKNYAGIKVCRMALGHWGKEVVARQHPRGGHYYWMVGEYSFEEPKATDTDHWALQNGFVAITPTTMDVTAYGAMNSLKGLEDEILLNSR